jgi:hypothetical protein
VTVGVTSNLPSGTGRSLVPVSRPVEHDGAGAGSHCVRPSTEFLAQLAATAQSAPQTRARRREAADVAAAAYAATAAHKRPSVIKISL